MVLLIKMDFLSMKRMKRMGDRAFRIACWFMYDDCECDIDVAERTVLYGAKEPHRGDCTNEPFTCMRCCYEEAVKLAHRIRPVIEG